MRSTSCPRSGAAAVILLVALSALGCGTGTKKSDPGSASAPPADGTPRLVLFLVIDQARADHLERFRPLLRYGFDRLLRESAVFVDTHHAHALTETAPGHATLATGMHPATHGIVGNSWYDRKTAKVVDSDEDDRWDDDRSPYRLKAPTLSDRLKERWPESKVYGASGKSRGAILPVGLRADRAFWLDDETGRFFTSTYYGEAEPAWLAVLHRDSFPDRFFGTPWEALPEVLAGADEYDVVPLDRGLVYPALPRAIGRASVHPDESYYEDFYWTPFSDRYLLELARTIVIEENLGADAYPDFLALSFSALDLVGHAYGPDSPELLDTLLRLDRTLGDLLDFVEERIGLDNTLISLSADHGVSPVPEVSLARGHSARRFGLDENQCMQSIDGRLDDELGEADWFVGDFVWNPSAIAAPGASAAEVEATAKRLIESCPGVERVWTASELTEPPAVEEAARTDARTSPRADRMLRLYRNTFHPGRSPDLLIQFEARSVARSGSTTTHGSPYPYDTHVPWLLRVPASAGRTISASVETIDVAPTLASLLGVDLGKVDGVDRSGLLESGGPDP